MNRFYIAIVLAHASCQFCPAAEGQAALNSETRRSGAIEGFVRYVPDSDRPWRYGRSYVKDPNTGRLAEAVVALSGSKLPEPVAPATVRTQTVDQVSFQFVPETSSVRAGDSVRFTNSDESLHNVMTNDGGSPFNVTIGKGEDFVHPFDRASGLEKPVRIGCVFHGSMRAWIYVFDHPWFQVTGRDGQFRLDNVPVGEHRIALVHPAGSLRWEGRVHVKPNEVVAVEITLSPDDIPGSN